MKKLILLAIIAASVVANAQTIPTNPPTAGDVLTNIVVASGGSAVAQFALNLLPGWDKTATNVFGANELELETGPVFKSITAAGSTPYISVGANYFYTQNFGGGAEVITFGNGQGSSTIDSVHAFALGRKDLGNVAGHLILGAGRDINLNRFDVEFGGGLEYRYSTGVGLLVDTRYCYLIGRNGSAKAASKDDHEFLTRVVVTLHF